MVNRKRIGIFFMGVANIILLAHILIPHHHHHNGLVSLRYLQNNRNPISHDHSNIIEDHRHEDKSDMGTCNLHQLNVVPSNLLRQLQSPDNIVVKAIYNPLFLSISPASLFLYSDIRCRIFRVSFKVPYFLSSVIPCCGLRAPPLN
jgi:hypothetical protein